LRGKKEGNAVGKKLPKKGKPKFSKEKKI